MGTIYQFTREPKQTNVHVIIAVITSIVSIVLFVSDYSNSEASRAIGVLPLSPALTWMGDWWRLLSCSLVHGNPFHLLMNIWFIVMLGKVYEPLCGWFGFLIVYVLSVLGGSIAVLIFGEAFIPVVGASGGAYGLLGGLLAAMYANTGSIRGIWASWFGRQLMIVLAINLFISLSPGISMLGHLGGLISGILVGYLIERYRQGPLYTFEKAGAVLLLLVIVGLTMYSVRPTHRGAYRLIQAIEIADRAALLYNSGERESVVALIDQYEILKARGFNDLDESPLYLHYLGKTHELVENLKAGTSYDSLKQPATPSP